MSNINSIINSNNSNSNNLWKSITATSGTTDNPKYYHYY